MVDARTVIGLLLATVVATLATPAVAQDDFLDDFTGFDDPLPPTIDRPITIAEMRQLAEAALRLGHRSEQALRRHRATLRSWGDRPYFRLAHVLYIPPPLEEAAQIERIGPVDAVSGCIDLISLQRHRISQLVETYDPRRPLQDDDDRLDVLTQTDALREIRSFVDVCAYGRAQAIHFVVEGTLDDLQRRHASIQGTLLDDWRGQYEAAVAELEAGGQTLDSDDEVALALQTRSDSTAAAEERRALATLTNQVEETLAVLAREYETLGDDLSRWIASSPRQLPAVPARITRDTFFYATADVAHTRDLGIIVRAFFDLPPDEIVDTELSERSIADFRDLMRNVFHTDDEGNRHDEFIGHVHWNSKVTFPNLAVPRARKPMPTLADLARLEPSPYPDHIAALVPTIEGVALYGTGLPSAATNDWSWLVPKPICDAKRLNGRWIVLVVHGHHLFEIEGREPELTWASADGHLKYELLGTSKFGEDVAWTKLWNRVKTNGRAWAGQDCYMIGVALGPQTWAGEYAVRLGDTRVAWTLPHATNLASTRFVHEVTEPLAEVEPIWCGFSESTVYVEVRTTATTPTADSIPFQLFASESAGDPQLVRFGPNLSDTVLHAHRTADDMVFRSHPIELKHIEMKDSSKGEHRTIVGMKTVDRLAARVVPHGVVRQDARMALLTYRTGPEVIGLSWYDAVQEASRVSGIAPPKPWDELTVREFGAFLHTRWTTVDSTTYVRVGGRQIDVHIGDLAAMILIRAEFVRQMRLVSEQLGTLVEQDDPEKARVLLAPLARAPNSAIGDIPVEVKTIAANRPFQTVPFRTVFDDAWLDRNLQDDLERRTSVDAATMQALRAYTAAANQATTDATHVELADAEAMVRLATIGMQPIADRLLPCMIQTVAIDGDEYVELDPVARAYVRTIRTLGDEFIANEALMDQYNARLALVAAGIGMLSPASVTQAVAFATVSTASFSASLTGELPEYFARRRDVRFALGAYGVIGPQRYGIARMRAKPGWAMALELAGGALDCSIALSRLATQVRSVRHVPDEAVAEALEDVRTFALLDDEARPYAIARIVELENTRALARPLNEMETEIVRRAAALLDEAGTRPKLAETLALRGDTSVAETARSCESTLVGRVTTVPRIEAELPGTLVLPDDTSVATLLARPATGTLREMEAWGNTVITIERLSLAEDGVWHGYVVGDRIGRGSFMSVFELPRRAGEVLKASHTTRDGHVYLARHGGELLARIRHAVALMDDIPQLAIRESKDIGGIAVVIQQRIGDGEYVLRRVRSFVSEPGRLAEQIGEAPVRTVGVVQPGGDEVVTMTRAQTRAVCALYQKFLDKGLVWYDGHLANIVFEGTEATTIAKVLDQDFVWKWDESFWAGPVGKSMGHTLEEVYLVEHPTIRNRLPSMLGARLPDDAGDMLGMGQHLYPDAEYFMLKMLEFHGYVNYIPGRGFVDGAARLQDVLEFMPAMQRRMHELIDPDLNRMVPPRQSSLRLELRHAA